MRKYIIPIMAIALGAATSCVDLNLTPKSKLTPEGYFRNENDLKLFSNAFYKAVFDDEIYAQQSDIMFEKGSLPSELIGTEREVPKNAESGGWKWTTLRRINTMLDKINQCSDEAAVKEYSALAKFFRVEFYFDKVKRFGDVPWYDTELGSTDESLYKPRDSRELVMSNMLNDIDEAIAGLPEEVSLYRVNKWAACMLKAQFCLYEGTYRKYHNINLEGHTADEYLKLAYEAAKEVMDCGKYTLAPDYGELFREVDADKREYILARKFDRTISVYHNATQYAIERTPGLSKKFVDSFLMKDGSRFTDKDGWETMSFVEETSDRDPRLGMIMRLPSYVRETVTYGVSKGPDLQKGTSTGYQIDKYVMDPSYPTAQRASMSFNDLPIFRLAEAYLIYAEAKAELNILTQEDVDKSINIIRDRAGMPHLVLAGLTADPFLLSENYGYRNLSKVNPANLAQILEIRRERTIELCLEGSTRWDDIMRWKEGETLMEPLRGMYVSGPGEMDLTGDGIPDIYLYATAKIDPKVQADYTNKYGKSFPFIQIQEIDVDGTHIKYSGGLILSDGTKGFVAPFKNKESVRKFDENRDYLYPIPMGDRALNPNLEQNPGWSDGLSDETSDEE